VFENGADIVAIASLLPASLNAVLTVLLLLWVWRLDRVLLSIRVRLEYAPPCRDIHCDARQHLMGD
jgi:hypothetical protein